MNRKSHIRMMLSGISLALVAAACSSEKKEGAEKEGAEHAEHAAAPGAAASVPLTGDTILVETWTDATGNYFKPNKLEAHRGDVIRWVLKQGVHNVHFLPDSNTIKEGLPPVSDFLQLPGQTYDLVVSLKEGEYYFQCDPHAALGMKGHLKVEEKD
ncbi:MAG TPA: plastocyanin/azurin family copper-binding protein [Gemmatimonadaceae bacterium]|jgi:plastocyanin|nr:plastocyanin/azurin family copper-binding protein [Gemmatimonadaceae bacterium]